MFSFLNNEHPVASLKHGTVQTLFEEELFSSTNMILTDIRLLMVWRKLGSNNKSAVFLKDITTINVKKEFSLGQFLLACLLTIGGLFFLRNVFENTDAAESSRRMWIYISLALFACAILLFFICSSTRIIIYTSMKQLQFNVSFNISHSQAEQFVDIVQSQMAKYKS